MSVHDRVLTKIGLNLVAKLLGLDLIRIPAFDAAVAYARAGNGAIYKLPPQASAEFTEMLGAPLPDRHNHGLLSVPRPNVVFGACKVLDLNSIFVEDVKALCLA